jgi:hypothetical protein
MLGENKPPVVDILLPIDGTEFLDTANITFNGTATDPEDGDISDNLDWESDLDGILATDDSTFNTDALSVLLSILMHYLLELTTSLQL